jgi:nicotinamidase-related amidase
VLQNLGVRNIVFVGGHAGACLGKTAASAKRLGYRMLCVADATNDAAESRRMPNLRATGYDYIVTTDELIALAKAAAAK